MKKKLLILLGLLLSGTNALGLECETKTFDLGGAQNYIYSDGRTWNFTVSKDINVTQVQTVSRIAGPNGNNLTIQALINGSEIARWNQSVITAYINYSLSQAVTTSVNSGDILTYKISGGSLSTPGGAITGENSISLCYEPPCQNPTINSFTASSNSIRPGESATLQWSIADATSASIDQGIGPVAADNGSTSITPASSTAYTLTASNSCGSVTSKATVSVVDPDKSKVLQGALQLLLYKPPVQSTTLGLQCSDSCGGSVCLSSSSTCTDTDLTLGCVGTATGMFCSNSCTTDSDCANPNTAMRCLTTCSGGSMYVNKCWAESDYTFLMNVVCD
ncbi:MAG: hypothetical protein V2I36_02305 [Desulfopila sp.]|nr:hypothetical protein [Desulfopila sp.]